MNKKVLLLTVLIVVLIATLAIATKWSDYGDFAATFADDDTFLFLDFSDKTFAATGTQKEVAVSVLMDNIRDYDNNIWQVAQVSAGAFIPDGANCDDIAATQLSDGPFAYTTTCADNAGSDFEFLVPMPENWDGGGANDVKVGIQWVMHADAGDNADTVIWGCKGQSRGHGDEVDNVYTNEDTVTVTFGAAETQWDVYYSEITIDEALNGAGGDVLFIYCSRAADTATEAVEVITGLVYYKIDDFDAQD